jgi:ABC-type bacteriocin/lantibiotic exporter with double-glycine peptidase domain
MSKKNEPADEGGSVDLSDFANDRLDLKTGLYCIAVVAKQRNISISLDDLIIQFGSLSNFTFQEMLRACSELKIKSKRINFDEASIKKVVMPVIIFQDDQYFILNSIEADIANLISLVHKSSEITQPVDDLIESCNGEAILITSDQGKVKKKYNFKWFLKKFWKKNHRMQNS